MPSQTMTFQDVIANPRFESVSFMQTIARNKLIASGIAKVDPSIAEMVKFFSNSGVYTQLDILNLPFLNDNDDEDQILTDSADIETRKTSMGQDVCSIKRSAHSFERTDLAYCMNTTDPMLAIANHIGDYWNRKYQAQTFAVIDGIFASNVANDDSDLVMDISAEAGDDGIITGNSMLIAAQLLGDVKENLVAVAMHSQVETHLNIIGAIPKTGAAKDNPMVVSYWNQRAVVMDDACHYDPVTQVADIILFKQGALTLNNVPLEKPYELGREPKKSKDFFISRRGRIIHHRGVKYTHTVQAKEHATNAEYRNAANWLRVVEQKRMGIVKLRVRLG